MNIPIKVVAALVATLFFAVGIWKIFSDVKQHYIQMGMQLIQTKWDEQVRILGRQAAEQAATQQQVMIKTVTKFVEKAAQERIVYRDIMKEIDKYVPSDLPMLPADFRVLHDAAAAGVALPEVGDTGGVVVAAISVKDVAVTVAENYATCRYDQGRLEALQTIIKSLDAD